MSGVLKSAKEVFKKVKDNAKTIIPIALGIGAVVFTAGAALGIAPLAGGWGAAAGSLTSSLGMSGTLANVVTGAVTQAGYGAAIGAATSAITGGDIGEGAMFGAAAGAVTGGVSGGLGWQTDPLANAFDGGTDAAGTMTGAPAQPTSTAVTGDVQAMPAAQNVSFAPGVSPGSTTPMGFGGRSPSALAPGGWVERNGELVGGVVKGAAGGLIQGMSSRDDVELRKELAAQRASNYRGSGRGLMVNSRASGDGSENPSVMDRTGDRLRDVRYYFNPETSRIEERPA